MGGSICFCSGAALDHELAKIVNVSMALEMPLLLKGEPGTGKTMLAHAIAESLAMPLIILRVEEVDGKHPSVNDNCLLRIYPFLKDRNCRARIFETVTVGRHQS